MSSMEMCAVHSASSAVAGSQDVQSRWLLAQCCMSMNKYTEAEQALNPNNDGTDVRLLQCQPLQHAYLSSFDIFDSSF